MSLDSFNYTNKLYLAALTTGATKEEAKLIAAAGISLQYFTRIYPPKTLKNEFKRLL